MKLILTIVNMITCIMFEGSQKIILTSWRNALARIREANLFWKLKGNPDFVNFQNFAIDWKPSEKFYSILWKDSVKKHFSSRLSKFCDNGLFLSPCTIWIFFAFWQCCLCWDTMEFKTLMLQTKEYYYGFLVEGFLRRTLQTSPFNL